MDQRSGSVRKLRSLWRRLREVGPGGWLLLARTFCLLLAAKCALRVFPVRRVIAWKQRAVRSPQAGQECDLRHIRHAVLVTARYSPIRFVCFPQCLAAAALLRSRGIESRLHYGVTRFGAELVTHTWLEAGGEIVIGGEVAAEYSTLAIY